MSISPEILERGERLYQLNCAPCHGSEGRGDGRSAASLDPPPRDHTDSELMEQRSDRRIAEVIREGGAASGYPSMPNSPHVQGDDLVALVAFVRSLHRDAVPVVDLEGYQ